jgi:hypothetical protein
MLGVVTQPEQVEEAFAEDLMLAVRTCLVLAKATSRRSSVNKNQLRDSNTQHYYSIKLWLEQSECV